MAASMEFGLLGSLVVRCDGALIGVPRGNQRAVLAALLLDAGRVVPVDDLARLLWGQQPPASARVTVQNYVKRLRQALGEGGRDRVRTHPGGYSISVGDAELDVSRFWELADSARVAVKDGSWDEAAERARAALSLWRGEPLTGVQSEALAAREVPRLIELHLQALEAWLDAELHLGCHAQAVPGLQRLVREHPLREHPHALLMLALYRCERQAEALAVYQDARRVLVGELGVEPGAELRELHQRILVADPALAPPGAPPEAPAPEAGPAVPAGLAPLTPRQLPGMAAHFTGRVSELAALDAMLRAAGDEEPGTVVITTICGAAGVGKTALAVRWSHRVADQFPDGQLYVNLRGFDPSGTPAETGEVIRGFLEALGVAAERIPPGLATQAGLYRSLLAGRKLLIVLDNARCEQQVRPLLPAGPGCLVLLTSRSALTGLAAAEGARLLSLRVLDPAEARQMLAARLGCQHAEADPAVAEIARLCAYLPLALSVAAARAAARPGFPLAALATELRAGRSRLDALDSGDPEVSVRGVFSWSQEWLSDPGRRMFRLLGVHPGPDISVAAAASLAGADRAEASRSLAELTRAHLLAEHRPGRYAFHDLLRAYAAEQVTAGGIDGERREAIGRVLDHYRHTANAANRLLQPAGDALATITPPRPGVTPERLAGSAEARAWLHAERRVLLALLALAADDGIDTRGWQLPRCGHRMVLTRAGC
jgi:DNA-binding SARP family transcriptional activator